MSTVITIAQQKGGVGKTTTARELAVILGQRGDRVLGVDVDPQSALTRQLGIRTRDLPLSLVDVLTGRASARDVIVKDIHGIDVLPGNRELAGVELALVSQVARESSSAMRSSRSPATTTGSSSTPRQTSGC